MKKRKQKIENEKNNANVFSLFVPPKKTWKYLFSLGVSCYWSTTVSGQG